MPLIGAGCWRSRAERARRISQAPSAIADREAAKGVSETYQYLVGDAAFYFRVDDGSVELHDGRADDPAVTLTTGEETWLEARLRADQVLVGGRRGGADGLGRPQFPRAAAEDLLPQVRGSGWSPRMRALFAPGASPGLQRRSGEAAFIEA